MPLPFALSKLAHAPSPIWLGETCRDKAKVQEVKKWDTGLSKEFFGQCGIGALPMIDDLKWREGLTSM